MRSSRDLAKRLRFELRPRPYAFRRLYFVLGAAACAAALGAWFLFGAVWGERQYLPGPVSRPHATFGDRCDRCHTQAFAAVPDEACGQCHAPHVHSEFEVETQACRSCHVEHRGEVALVGDSDRPCIGCHAGLVSKRAPAAIATRVPDFGSHPPFVPLRAGSVDGAALRFNHELHLTSQRIPADRKLECASCHVVDGDGGLMRPIVFESHCRDCHRQGGFGPLSDVEVVHEAPEVVRRDLRQQLLAVAVNDPQRVFGEAEVFLPGRKRGAIDQSRSLAEFEKTHLEAAEALLYAPFVDQTPLEQNNKYCFLCHLQGEAEPAGGLPAAASMRATKLPSRWLERSVFSHRAHGLVACQECHGSILTSASTSEVNLPGNALCQRCHLDGGVASAGTGCTACHLYHDPDEPRARPLPVHSIDLLLGLPASSRPGESSP